MSRLEDLSERYGEHHRAKRTREFVYAGEERVRLFRDYVGGPGRRVLDLGCRYGALTRAYARGNEVIGVDVDREALAEAAKLGIETQWADVDEPLPFDDASFDVVVAAEVLEHLSEPRWLVREVARVLRPNGTFVGSVPNAFRLKNRLRYLGGHPPEPEPTHVQLFRPADVSALLDGFSDVRLEFVAGRFLKVHPRLFANAIVFTAGRGTAGRGE
jgi:2-polyprenyl-3-methyl-5-hydroxy-6-metoxy-1,4-benzoquinol methylase